jgi:hypothetical protein
MRGRFPRTVQGHAWLCVAWRFQEEKLLLPIGISVGEGYAPDPLFGAKALGVANPVVFSEVERAGTRRRSTRGLKGNISR